MSATAPDSHTSRYKIPVSPVAALIFGLQAGTGGAVTIDYLRTEGDKGYHSPWLDLDREVHSPHGAAASPAKNLDYIRSVLRPSVTALARALGVSRQAIYDWQAGRPIAADNVARLHALSRAADLFASEGLHPTAHVIPRPRHNGNDFFSISH